MEQNKFGDWLKASREAAGMNKKELADAAGIAPTYVSNLENGHQQKISGKPTLIAVEKCDRISLALGKSIWEGRAAAGYLPPVSEFQAIALDVESWSEENRRAAFLQMERIYNQFKEKESKKVRPKTSRKSSRFGNYER